MCVCVGGGGGGADMGTSDMYMYMYINVRTCSLYTSECHRFELYNVYKYDVNMSY